MRRLMLAGATLLAVPAVAFAAAPANDGPDGAAEFDAYDAGNLPSGTKAGERQGLADLTEATADRGVPRCLGRGSFDRTVWFRVPAADTPQLVSVEASSPSQGTAEVPDLALYVSGQTKVAQSCDGPATGSRATSAAVVAARLPAGTSALVQVGRSAGQQEQRVVAALRATPLEKVKAPAGDQARKAPLARVGRTQKVALAGATLTAEDPAQPACPAVATVWRRTKVSRGGRHRVVVRGRSVGAVTAFVGKRPTANSAKACVNRVKPGGALALKVRVRRGGVLWTRIGVDGPTSPGAAKLRVKRLG